MGCSDGETGAGPCGTLTRLLSVRLPGPSRYTQARQARHARPQAAPRILVLLGCIRHTARPILRRATRPARRCYALHVDDTREGAGRALGGRWPAGCAAPR